MNLSTWKKTDGWENQAPYNFNAVFFTKSGKFISSDISLALYDSSNQKMATQGYYISRYVNTSYFKFPLTLTITSSVYGNSTKQFSTFPFNDSITLNDPVAPVTSVQLQFKLNSAVYQGPLDVTLDGYQCTSSNYIYTCANSGLSTNPIMKVVDKHNKVKSIEQTITIKKN